MVNIVTFRGGMIIRRIIFAKFRPIQTVSTVTTAALYLGTHQISNKNADGFAFG